MRPNPNPFPKGKGPMQIDVDSGVRRFSATKKPLSDTERGWGEVKKKGEKTMQVGTVPTLKGMTDTERKTETHARSPRWKSLGLGLIAFALGAGSVGLWLSWREKNEVVASVNGVTITRQALQHRMEIASGNATLQQMIAEEEQLQFARQKAILPSDADVETKYAELSKQPDFAQKLAAGHQTPDDLRRALRVSMLDRSALTQGVTVTDAEIQAFYRFNTDKNNPNARYYRPETLRLAVVISDQEGDIAKAAKDLAAGKPFVQVAQTYSKDRTKADNGLLAPLQRGRMNSKQFPGVEGKLFALKPGDQIDSIKINGAWWLIRCLEKSPETTLPFEQVKEECRTGAQLTKGLPANLGPMQSAYADFQKSAVITLAPEYRAQPSAASR